MTRIEQALIAGALGAALSAGAFGAPTTLRASHQFPGGRGDVRDEMVQIIAREAKAANVELEIQVYPGASPLFARASMFGVGMSGHPLKPTSP